MSFEGAAGSGIVGGDALPTFSRFRPLPLAMEGLLRLQPALRRAICHDY